MSYSYVDGAGRLHEGLTALQAAAMEMTEGGYAVELIGDGWTWVLCQSTEPAADAAEARRRLAMAPTRWGIAGLHDKIGAEEAMTIIALKICHYHFSRIIEEAPCVHEFAP